MIKVIEAIYENGILRPLEPLKGVAEHSKLKVTIESEATAENPLLRFASILSDEEAAELKQIIGTEFEKTPVNLPYPVVPSN